MPGVWAVALTGNDIFVGGGFELEEAKPSFSLAVGMNK